MAALTAKGSTPASNSLEDIIAAINKISTDVKHSISVQVDHSQSVTCRVYADGKTKINKSNDKGSGYGTWYVGSFSI